MSPEDPVADPEDLQLDMYFAKLSVSFPKILEPMNLDEIKFSFISQICDVLPVFIQSSPGLVHTGHGELQVIQ